MALPLRTGNLTKTQSREDSVLTPATTADRLPNYGKTILSSTAAKTYVMEAPQAGVRKVIVQSTTSTAIRSITGPTTTVVFNPALGTALAFTVAGQLLELEGRTPLIWDIVSNEGTVTVS